MKRERFELGKPMRVCRCLIGPGTIRHAPLGDDPGCPIP